MTSAPIDPRPLRFAFTDTRRWVMIGAAIGALAYATLAIVNFRAWGWDTTRCQLMLVAAGLGCATGAVLAARNRVFAGGLVCVFCVWCEVHLSLLTSQRFPSQSMLATSTVLVAGALLLRPRHSMLFAAVTIVVTWPLVILSPAVRATGVTSTVIYWLTAHAVVMIAAWALVALGFSVIDEAFAVVVRKERELAETISRSPDGILVFDADERLQMLNPVAERVLGVSQADCLGRSISQILNDVSARGDMRGPISYRDSGKRPYLWSVPHPDGRQLELEVSWRTMDEGRRREVSRFETSSLPPMLTPR